MKTLSKAEHIAVGFIPVAVGVSFVAGTFTSAPVLGLLPDVVHTVLGYGLMAIGGIAVFKGFKK